MQKLFKFYLIQYSLCDKIRSTFASQVNLDISPIKKFPQFAVWLQEIFLPKNFKPNRRKSRRSRGTSLISTGTVSLFVQHRARTLPPPIKSKMILIPYFTYFWQLCIVCACRIIIREKHDHWSASFNLRTPQLTLELCFKVERKCIFQNFTQKWNFWKKEKYTRVMCFVCRGSLSEKSMISVIKRKNTSL